MPQLGHSFCCSSCAPHPPQNLNVAGLLIPQLGQLIFVRGAEATPLQVWPEERRSQNGVVLSDHAPVELTVP